MSVCTFISVKSTLNFDLSERGPCFFRFNMIMWNAGMAYGYEVTSQLSFWLVTTLTDFYFHWAKPAHCPVFPFCPATVTQTWLLAQALTRMHINTISCSTGFNTHIPACTHTHTHMPNPYTLPHPSTPFDTKSGLTPLVPFSQPVMARNRWIPQTHHQQ